jgi:nucleoid-associated protein YgaU
VAVIVVLQRAGRGRLAPPPLTSAHDLSAWVGNRSTAEVVMAVIRLAARCSAWYLLVGVVLSLTARLVGWGAAVRVADLFSPGPIRRALAAATVGVSATAFLAPAAGASPSGPRATGVVTMHRLPDDGAAPTSGTAPPPAPPADMPPAADTWTIAPGENLWFVARDTLADAWGRSPTATEVTSYWKTLIDQNRDRLPDPGNPDLVFTGTVLELPETPPLPA